MSSATRALADGFAFLILLARFSLLASLCFSHKQLSPLVFSTHQHLKYKPPKSAFKSINTDQATSVDIADANDARQDEQLWPEVGTAGDRQAAADKDEPT